jgi:hypothetical protein
VQRAKWLVRVELVSYWQNRRTNKGLTKTPGRGSREYLRAWGFRFGNALGFTSLFLVENSDVQGWHPRLDRIGNDTRRFGGDGCPGGPKP